MSGSAGGLEKMSAGLSGLVKKPLDCSVANGLHQKCDDQVSLLKSKVELFSVFCGLLFQTVTALLCLMCMEA